MTAEPSTTPLRDERATGLEAFSLAGRTALVTGVSRGIGQAIAVGLALAGADLVLAGRSGSLDGTRAMIEELGRDVTTVDVDLARPEDVADGALDDVLPTDVDILVNNAGVIHREEALTVGPDAWRSVLDVNLNSVFFLSQRVAGPMLARGHGKIINIASLLSFEGGLNVTSYAASKHAVAGLTRALSNEWAARGIQVNAIAPGYIVTDNTARLRADPERTKSIDDRIPAGRWGLPSDLVGAAVFLASSASDYVSGHVLLVDGGWSGR
ncbi:SDR family oxidoreductase [Nitriliruptoraceae bacterium ZYF776]|nr:SDR family oxidoreductase [Profundirhabdus halotolerans]